MAVYFPKASKPTFYWVFACARLADVAVRGVELQQRRSSDRFGGSSLRRRACGASDDQTAKWPSTEYTRKICPESTGAQYQGQGFFGTSYLLLSWHSQFLARVVASCASISVRGAALIFQYISHWQLLSTHTTVVVDPSADGRMVGSPVLGMRRTEQLRAGPRRTSTLAKVPEIINSGEPDSSKLQIRN